MTNSSITVPLDPETALAYESAAPEEKKKNQALVSLWVRDLATGQRASLEHVLDEVGKKAQANGLTPEILESLLKDT